MMLRTALCLAALAVWLAGLQFIVRVDPPIVTFLTPNSGAVASTVVMTGQHFGPAQENTTLKLNGVAVTVTSWSDTSVTFTVPSTTTGQVVMVRGGVASNGLIFTVTSSVVTCTAPTDTVKIVNSLSAVQSWVNGAANGSYGCVAAGSSSSWGDRVIFPRGKTVSVIGASLWGGGTSTIAEAGSEWNCDGCTCPGPSSRFGGFTINNSSVRVAVNYCSQNVRFDHNLVTYSSAGEYITSWGYNNSTTSSANWYEGEVSGVFDHNTFQYVRAVTRGGVQGPNGNSGNDRWAEPLDLGTAHGLYFEDNSFTYLDGSQPGNSYLNTFDGNQGCVYTVRFNTLNNARAEWHSLQGINDRGCKRWEMYYNNWTNVSTPSGAPHSFRQWFVRGGTGVIHHDTSDGNAQHPNVFLDNDRSEETSVISQMGAWGMCAIDGTAPYAIHSAGTSFIDANGVGLFGWLCRDSIGASQDVSRWGAAFPNPAPAQIHQPAYIWRNTDPRGEIPVELNCEGSGIPCSYIGTYHIIANRDYYIYNAAFNGTSGVGEGVLASRPATCTTGVAYWVTDRGSWRTALTANTSGRLDVCTGTNTWTDGYYTPYTYPHPRTAS